MSHSSKVVLVTGANKGIGYEAVKLLADKHPQWTILLGCRDPKKGEAALQSLAKTNVVLQPLDVTSKDSINEAAKLIKSRYGGLDYLLQNAGISSGFDDSFEATNEVFATNIFGVQHMQEAFSSLIKPAGFTVVVSSEVGPWTVHSLPPTTAKILDDIQTLTGEKLDELISDYLNSRKPSVSPRYQWADKSKSFGAYGMSKAFLNSYLRLRVKEHPNEKIIVVCPGYCATDLNQHRGHRSAVQGAISIIWPIEEPDKVTSGHFYQDEKELSFSSPMPKH